MEKWKPIIGFEGLYEVSNLGRVRSVATGAIRKSSIVRGYNQLGLRINGIYKNVYVHRLVLSAFAPNPDHKPQVNHIDGNKQNNRLDNLEWVTQTENLKHAYATGLKRPANYGGGRTKIRILQLDQQGGLIKVWDSYAEIKRAKSLTPQFVREAIRGQRHNYQNSIWKIEIPNK